MISRPVICRFNPTLNAKLKAKLFDWLKLAGCVALGFSVLIYFLQERLIPVLAQLRVIVKRILNKYEYPPDKQEKATQTVLEQAEVLSQEWAAA